MPTDAAIRYASDLANAIPELLAHVDDDLKFLFAFAIKEEIDNLLRDRRDDSRGRVLAAHLPRPKDAPIR